jgi:hypothetical protein
VSLDTTELASEPTKDVRHGSRPASSPRPTAVDAGEGGSWGVMPTRFLIYTSLAAAAVAAAAWLFRRWR